MTGDPRGLRGLNLTGSVRKTQPFTIGTGAFTDVYIGEYMPAGQNPIPVAIKIFRGVHSTGDLEAMNRRLERESRVWYRLNHQNVLPYFGWCNSPEIGPSTALISPFCHAGSIGDHLMLYPHSNRLNFIRDIINGLNYLHENRVVHGDLHCNNILVNNYGQCCLADFGRSKVLDHAGYTTTLAAGCAEYMAPELFPDEEDGESAFLYPYSFKSDVYAFGMVAFELLTDHKPLHRTRSGKRPHPGIIIQRIIRGERPRREYDIDRRISDDMWRMLVDCWSARPEHRPPTGSILQAFG